MRRFGEESRGEEIKKKIEGRVGPSKHNCRSIVFIGLTITTCFGRAWPSSGHKLSYK